MQSISLFLFKSVLISALLFLYYWLVLRNRKFHSFNRFYLLASIIVSIVLPFLNFEWYNIRLVNSRTAIHILQAINSDEVEKMPLIRQSFFINIEMLLTTIYLLVSTGMLMALIGRIYWIYRIKRYHEISQMHEYDMVHTQLDKAPFSFMKTLFWKDDIDPDSRQGKQILKHEVVHMQQWHTLDKLFMQLVLVVLWINPVYWLVKKELALIHEFIADEEAIGEEGTEAFAEMLLTAHFTKVVPDIIHPFFYSPIKRRILMLNKHNKTRYSSLRRLLVLPLIMITTLLFSFNRKNTLLTRADKKVVMVIDAGHGGQDKGAIAENGMTEKDMVLKITNKIEQLAEQYNIEVVPTRKSDIYPTLDARAQKANIAHADLLISIHINASDASTAKYAPYQVLADSRNAQFEASSVLASAIINHLSASGKQAEFVRKGLWVLKQANMPGVLIECGRIDNAEEMARINKDAELEQLCRNILDGVVDYENSQEKKK